MKIVIVGAGGHGKVVLDILRAANRYQVVGFLDANESLHGQSVLGSPVLGALNLLPKLRSQRVEGAIIAIGDNAARVACAQEAAQAGLKLINAIHPSAAVSTSARLGANIVIAAGACICVDSSIGDSCIINTSAVVDHECQIDPGAHLCPGVLLAGRVHIGELAMIGLGAKVIQCLQVGPRTIVGAGAVVLEDLPGNVTAVGIPAKIIRATGV
jgi:acetyltransferase EpsM